MTVPWCVLHDVLPVDVETLGENQVGCLLDYISQRRYGPYRSSSYADRRVIVHPELE